MLNTFQHFNLWSLTDILIISVLIYHVLTLIRGTRAAQILTGILIITIVFQASSLVPLSTLNWLMDKYFSSIVLITIILFQDDIRNALSKIGKKSILTSLETTASHHIIDELTRGAFSLAAERIGALIVIERNILLTRYVDIGIALEAKISKEIMHSIFTLQSPIHDGAIIVRQGRIASGGCFLPLTKKENLKPEMGTRHRAAIGISQETDCLVILISEERGTVSLVVDGTVRVESDQSHLRKSLRKYLTGKTKSVRSIYRPSEPFKRKGS